MSRSKNSKKKATGLSFPSNKSKHVSAGNILPLHDSNDKRLREKRFAVWVLAVLSIFGIYKSIVLFGAYPVPNPDFAGFVKLGQQLLNFEMPDNFKRAPVVGILQVLLSRLVGGDQPLLTAGWLLNAILCPLNVILAWQVGKKIIGPAAILFAVAAMLNPWVLRAQVNPIAETAMIFFMLASFFFLFCRSRWCYVFASIASMVRYECVILIFICFVWDMLTRKGVSERFKATLRMGLALTPFLLWMLGTYINWETTRGSHYLRSYGRGMIGMGYIKLVWEATFMLLFELPCELRAMFVRPSDPEAVRAAANILDMISRIVVVGGGFGAVVWGLYKRNGNILALITFLFFYVLVHAAKINSHHRYCVPIVWMTLLIVWYGLGAWGKLINRNNWLPKSAGITVNIIIFLIVFVWLIRLFPYLSRIGPYCVKAVWLPYVSMGTVVLILLLSLCFFRFKSWSGKVVLATVVCLMLVSQHFTTARLINNGTYYLEFKYLLDWYKTRVEPGAKMATRWTHILHLMSVSNKKNLIDIKSLKSDTFEGFVQNCREEKITYIAWSHRGSKKTKRGIENLSPVLSRAKSNGPLQFIQQIRIGRNHINIFKLQRINSH